MNAKDVILFNFGMSDRLVSRYLEDLTDADLLVRPVDGQNHIAWQIGHLIHSERSMVEMIRPGSCPALPEGFEAAHGRDEASTRSDDASRFLKKDEYLALMKKQREATKAVLESFTDAEMDGPAPERFAKMLPNAGSVLAMVGTHVLMHVGQFVSVRRALKKPVTI
jgi:hypothetical protein